MNRLRTKLSLALLGVVLLALVLAGALGGLVTRYAFVDYVAQAQRAEAEALAETLGAYYEREGSWEGAEFLAAGLCGHMPGRGFGMGRGMGGGASWALVTPGGEPVFGEGETAPESVRAGVPVVAGGQTVAYLTPPQDGGPVLGPTHQSFLSGMYVALGLSGVAAAAVALGVGVVLSRNLTGPLTALSQAASAVAGGDFSRRVKTRSRDEVGELSAAFNRMAQELEEAERLRRRLTADIAHELRTPISVIQGHLEAMMDGVFPPDRKHLAAVHEETQLLTRLVNDLRTLALAEAGELSLEKREIDLAELARRAAESFRPLAQEKGIELEEPPQEEIGPVSADGDRVGQVMGILLSNAIRHTPEGGRIEVKLGAEPGGVRVEVRDSGSGIPPEELPYVFERLWRADASRSRDTGGSGLGLAIARELVEAHGGIMGVESELGVGTSFHFVLPRR